MEQKTEALHPDEKSPEERWTEAFDKVFADLRAKHPADEWTLRLVTNGKESPVVEAVVASHLRGNLIIKPEEELVVLEQLGVTNVTENDEGVAADVVGLTHCSAPAGQQEKTEENGDGIAINSEPVDPLLIGVGISQPDAIQQPGKTDDPDSISAPIPATDDDNQPQPIVNCLPADEPQEQPEAAEELAQCVTAVQEQEAVPIQSEPEIQDSEKSVEEQAVQAQQPEELTVEEKPTISGEVEIVTDQGTPASDAAMDSGAELQGAKDDDGQDATDDLDDFEKVEATIAACLQEIAADLPVDVQDSPVEGDQQQDAAAVEVVSEPLAVKEDAVHIELEHIQQLDTAAIETASEPLAVEADAGHIELSVDLSASIAADGVPGLGPVNHDGSAVVEAELAKPVEEKSTLQQQSASSPNLAVDGNSTETTQAKKPRPATPGGKKRPNSPPPQPGSGDAGNRKPEWMRRPLVRKGSVGRFLGRMKTTMQSKRFGPDRLPVVPPPEPEPPKRPPRRKTLANLDLNRESVTASRGENQVDSASSPPSPPPPTPRSAPMVENSSAENRSISNKSATLRSTTSERKRRNSVGRLAESAASRIRRALSIKNLNSADGSQSATSAEAAPLLQQEAPVVAKQPSPPPVQRSAPPPSPAPEKSIKKDFVHLMHRMDPRHVLDRILTPKSPATEVANSKPALPERPPPPTAVVATKGQQVKPIVKNGKVQFECQKCQHRWTSVKGTARFEILINQVGEGIRQAQILVRLYGQRCKNCPTDEFETAEWSAMSIEKVLTGLRVEMGRRFYPDDQEPQAHQRQLCQACQEGVCRKKLSR